MKKLMKRNSLRGDTNIIAIIVIAVVIIAVAAIFRTQLIKAVNDIFDQLTKFISGQQ